jgi:hypothetical protein
MQKIGLVPPPSPDSRRVRGSYHKLAEVSRVVRRNVSGPGRGSVSGFGSGSKFKTRSW